ncbi:MAG: hypothetical protein ACXABY_30835 [Candidatus Thorarchaeota archaeon]|jgi:hypothetical protein
MQVIILILEGQGEAGRWVRSLHWIQGDEICTFLDGEKPEAK